MKKILLIALTALIFPNALLPQSSSNLQLVAHINPAPGTTYSEVTGCGDLAIIGAFQTNSFVWIYDLADKANPALLSAIPIQQACLDVQVHGRHLFISFVNGMAWYDIIDPRQPKLVHELKPPAPGINAHTSFVSGNTLYIADQVSDGVRIFDITDKKNPRALADVLEPGLTIHDMTIIRGRMYAAWIFGQPGGLTVVDVSTPSNPRLLAKIRYPQAATHSAWPAEDEQFILTTDEVSPNPLRNTLKIWDARTAGQLTQVAEFTPPGAMARPIVHNVYVRGRYAYLSHYCEGVRILDIANPNDPQEVAFYDFNGDPQCHFDSNWGVDPFSDLIYASDMQQGLFVLEFADHPPANVAGRVLDAATQNPVDGAVVYFLDEYPTTRSKANGDFGMVWFKDDTVRIAAEALGYLPDTTIVITHASSSTPLTIYLNGAPRLTIANSQIDDDNLGGSFGNGNGVIDAVETYELNLTLRNSGFAALANGAFRLRSNDPYVRIIDSLQTVGAIGISQTALLNGPLRFSASSPVLPVDHQLSFKLVATLNNQIVQEIEFTLPAQPPQIDGFRATTTANSVTLYWRPANDAALNGYHLYRKLALQADTDFAKITATVVTDTIFTVTGLATGEVLSFAITKVAGGIESLAGARLKVAVREGVPQILVVNGIDWETYGAEMTAMYEARPFNAGRIFDTWDVISEGIGFPSEYLIVGQAPRLTFDELRSYQAIVWVGNNFNGDLDAWRASLPALKAYLDNGGRLVLITRLLYTFLNDDDFLQNYLHLSRFQVVSSLSTIQWLNPLLSPLVVMNTLGNNTLNSGLQNVTPNDLVEPIFYLNTDPSTVMGIRARTRAHGPFNLVVISGRPYRLDANALRANMTIIINDWFGLSTSVDELAAEPESFALLPNYPNPFAPAIGAAATQIVFSLPQRENVQLEIFNVLGQRVRELLNAPREQGQHAVAWDGTNDAGQRAAAGVYVLRLRAGKFVAERKLTLVR
jgi:hypothetical protein